MNKKIRSIQIWFIRWLRIFRLIPNRWYRCEIEASKEEGKRLAKLLLAELERKMDSGEAPYVILHNRRQFVSEQAMAEFELITGQTISREIFCALMRFQIAECVAKKGIANASK